MLQDQVADEIRAQIGQGRFRPGDRLPAEPNLATEFGVSRDTLRSAIVKLVTELVLEKRRGIGTFVRESTDGPSHGLERLVGITEAIRSVGMTPEVVDLAVDHVAADAELHKTHGPQVGSELIRVERTWLADGRRALHGVDWIPTSVLKADDTFADFRAEDSLSARLASQGVHIVAAMSRILPELAGDETGRLLDLAPTESILRLRQVHYNKSQAVLYSDQCWGGHVLKLHILRRV